MEFLTLSAREKIQLSIFSYTKWNIHNTRKDNNSLVCKWKRRTTINHNVVSQDIAPSIPADTHTIKFISGDSFYIIRSLDSPLTNNKQLSLIDFIRLKSARKRILIENFQKNTTIDSLLHFLKNKSELLIASDGSKTRKKSGDGWVIAAKDGTIPFVDLI